MVPSYINLFEPGILTYHYYALQLTTDFLQEVPYSFLILPILHKP
jgi:hypothetical protein